MSAPTHLLVANPTARSGRNAASIDRALRALDAAGLRARLLPTEPQGRTVASVRDALDREEYRCVIAMGGDGTFREVAQGLLESARSRDVSLGMLPAGTANNHGRSFGLQAGDGALNRNVAVIAAGRETRLDAGELHTVAGTGTRATTGKAMFFDSVGWGIGAAIIAARNVDRARIARMGSIAHVYRDELVYAGALLRTLARRRGSDLPNGVSVVADGEPHELGPLAELLIRGTRVYAGGWVVDPTSRHDDGMFEVIPFSTRQTWLSSAALGLYGGPLVRAGLAVAAAPPGTLRASRIDIHFRLREGDSPPPAQLDGEELPSAERATITVIARAVRLIVP